MNTEALNCSGCGAALNYSGKMVCKCEYCGVTNFLSGESVKNSNKFNRANEERQKCNFDKAKDLYDDLLDEMAPTIDILWGKTLCIYGVEYVEDPLSHEYKPTLHRIGDEDIFECETFKEALELADDEQKKELEKDAGEISEINREYIRIANEEEPYDVFICYKDTEEFKDEDGNEIPTIDRERGTELYEQLKARGLKVFFSHRTLKTGEMFEPQIFAALNSAAAMILLLSNEEYINSVWLKNEWSRYRDLKKKDSRRSFFVVCEKPEKLPRWAQQQVSKVSTPGVFVDLASRVKEVLEKQYPERYSSEQGGSHKSYTTQKPKFIDVKKVYAAAKAQNQAGNFSSSNSNVSEIINVASTHAGAYWLRMCNNKNITLENLERSRIDLSKEADYINAINFATAEEKKEFDRVKDKCLENIEGFNYFLKKRKDVVDEYASDKRGKDLHKEIRKTEKKHRNSIEATLFFPKNNAKVSWGWGIVLFIGYLAIYFLAMLLICTIYDDTLNRAHGAGAINILVGWIAAVALLICSTYLRSGWTVLIGVLLFFGEVAWGVFVFAYARTFGGGIIMSLSFNVLFLAALIAGYIFCRQRPKRALKYRREYNKKFLEYAGNILSDISKTFDETQKEKGLNYFKPDNLYSEMNGQNWRTMDSYLMEYLQRECMYDRFTDVFL